MNPSTAYFQGHYSKIDTMKPAVTYIVIEKPIEKSNLLKTWIDTLVQAESQGDPDVVLETDWNGQSSNGCLQFQMETWLTQGKLYGFNTTTENIFDCSLQKELTFAMISDRRSNWMHWRCSVVGTNLEEELGLDTFCKENFAKRWNITNKPGIGLPPKS